MVSISFISMHLPKTLAEGCPIRLASSPTEMEAETYITFEASSPSAWILSFLSSFLIGVLERETTTSETLFRPFSIISF
ncbi:hypothetical protein R83H12_02844 [Fibrobacteria bacterium R8-3-H12]